MQALKKNDIVTVTITDMGESGEGIGKIDGFTLFVKGAVAGDVISARILKTKTNYGFAKVEEILTPSANRQTPPCPVAGRCGGCQLQPLRYEAQLRLKEAKVFHCLSRIGQIPEEKLSAILQPILGMTQPAAYRNKAQFPVATDKNGKPVTGFYAERSHDVISCTECFIQSPVNTVICQAVREHMEKYKIEAYSEATGRGLVRHILTRVGAKTGEVLCCLVLNGKKLPKVEELVENMKKRVSDGDFHLTLTSFCINVNEQKTNVILGEKLIPVYGEPYVRDRIGDILFHISPLSFYQVNPVQTSVLYETALSFAELSGNEIVWDLYCGIGTISLFLAKKAKMVYGVEIIPQAIVDARENAARNGIENVSFFVGAAEEVVPKQYEESNGAMHADVIVVDPPRKGCDESLLQTLVAMEPKKIVYVSCDPATLARDVKYLSGNGYELKKVQPVDMFPETVHVETVVLMSRKDK